MTTYDGYWLTKDAIWKKKKTHTHKNQFPRIIIIGKRIVDPMQLDRNLTRQAILWEYNYRKQVNM